MTTYDPASVPAPVGGYAQAREVPPGARLLFVSGQIPVTRDGFVPPDFDSQCRLVWAHVLACLREAGMGPQDIVKVNTYLARRVNADLNGAIRREVLGDHRPALTVVIATIFDPAWLLEIEVVAAQ